jgi:ribosomal protein L23
VNTIRVHGKAKGQLMRANRGRRPDVKKAILTVEAGTDIRLFENI